MLKEAIPHFAELSSSEKLLLLEELWDDLADHPSEVPVPDWQKRELERRYQDYLANPGEGTPWPDVREHLLRDDMATRAARGKLVDIDHIMSKVPDVPPQPGDELPPGYVSPLSEMRGFLRGMDTTIEREPDRL